MVVVDQVMDEMVHKEADKKAKELAKNFTEEVIEDEGTKVVGLMMVVLVEMDVEVVMEMEVVAVMEMLVAEEVEEARRRPRWSMSANSKYNGTVICETNDCDAFFIILTI